MPESGSTTMQKYILSQLSTLLVDTLTRSLLHQYRFLPPSDLNLKKWVTEGSATTGYKTVKQY